MNIRTSDTHKAIIPVIVILVPDSQCMPQWTKSAQARTMMPAPAPAFLARPLETEIASRGRDALVFPSARSSEYLTLGQARYAFQKAAAAVEGCQGVRLHDLRHTCASLAIREGANVKVVQKLLGHQTATLTLDRYGHLYPDDLEAVAVAFDAVAQSTADDLRTIPALSVVVSAGKTV
jgi:site-specific recombinase XerC